MFAERFKVTDRVGAYKAKKGLPAKDEAREFIQLDRIKNLALEYGLESEFAHSYLSLMIDRVVERHRALADQN